MIEVEKSFFAKIGNFEKWLAVFVILGVTVTLIGLFRGILQSRQVQIEYLKGGSEDVKEQKLVVDIEGAVKLPGVYELTQNSRIKDVLVLAGGYSEKADREYCEKNINLAQPLKDGQKIFVPEKSGTPSTLGYSTPKTGTNMININTASNKELDTLWGIGEARIESIVKNRPYESLEELVTKKVFTKQILEKNREKLSVN